MHKILNCTNLVGDSLYLLKPVDQFLNKFPGEAVALVADNGLSFDMFHNSFADKISVYRHKEQAEAEHPGATTLNLSAGQAGHIAFGFRSHPKGRQLHISEGYAKLLGFDLAGDIRPLTTWCRAQDAELLEPCILLSPFSASCTVHSSGVRNKTLDDWKWEHIIRYMRKQGYPVKILGGHKDLMKVSVPIDDYITASSLYDLELLLRSCKLLVTIDNGIGHIAATLDVPMISLWPGVSCAEFIAPIFGKKTAFVQFHSNAQVSPVALMPGIRSFTRTLLEDHHVRE